MFRLVSRRPASPGVALGLAMGLAVAGSAVNAQSRQPAPPVVDAVDLTRYAGVWYELGRLPFRFQRQCVGDVTAEYALRPDGRLDVINSCRTEKGTMSRAAGVARVVSTDGSNAKLEVRFAPAILSFIPAVWGDYWILDLAPDYSTAIVGTPDRKSLWILSRTPTVDEARYAALRDRAAALGYEADRIEPTRHTR